MASETTGSAQGPETVSCAVCRKEIPRSEALVNEAQDYVFYFCGAGCFDEWKQRAEDDFPPPAGHGDTERD